MLDFYFIDDNQVTPDYPEQAKLKLSGGINLSTFNSLVKKGIIESKYDYYEDFRWTNQIVQRITSRIEESSDSDFNDIYKILIQAINMNKGIIAYCD